MPCPTDLLAIPWLSFPSILSLHAHYFSFFSLYFSIVTLSFFLFFHFVACPAKACNCITRCVWMPRRGILK
jgi:hypothetical protein